MSGSTSSGEYGVREWGNSDEVETSTILNLEGGSEGKGDLNAKAPRRWVRVKDHRMLTDENPIGLFQDRKRKGGFEDGETNEEKKARCLTAKPKGVGHPKALGDQ